MENCTPGCIATKLILAGIILILVRTYTSWDIWVVLGALLIIKGLIVLIFPKCLCHSKKRR